MNPEQALEFVRVWLRTKQVMASLGEMEQAVSAVNVLAAAITKLSQLEQTKPNKSQKSTAPEPDGTDEDLVK